MSGAMRLNKGDSMSTTIKVFCEECNSEFLLDYVDTEEEPRYCPFCAEELDEEFIQTIDMPKFEEVSEWTDDISEYNNDLD
jgi:uncharacterized protein (UPF0212 family)